MPAAIIGGVIAGAGAIGAAAIGSGAQGRASDRATQATQNATRENNALYRETRDQNTARLTPYVNTGYAANNAINALLGLDVAPTAQQQPNALQGFGTPNYGAGPGGMPNMGQMQRGGWEMDPTMNVVNDNSGPTQPQPAGTQPAGGPSPYQLAFDNYRNSTGYQFRMGQGMNALNTGYAARGLLNSGAAQKAALQYGQNIASAEFGNYLGALGNQQGVGLSAGNALAGVSTNYANTVAGQNNAQASVIANAALAQGQANAGLWGTAAGALGNIGGSFFGSSYGGGSGARNSYGISGAGNIY